MSRSIRHQRDFRCIVGMSNKSKHEVNFERALLARFRRRRSLPLVNQHDVALAQIRFEVDREAWCSDDYPWEELDWICGPACGCTERVADHVDRHVEYRTIAIALGAP